MAKNNTGYVVETPEGFITDEKGAILVITDLRLAIRQARPYGGGLFWQGEIADWQKTANEAGVKIALLTPAPEQIVRYGP